MKSFKIVKNILNEKSEILNDYLEDIKKYSLITPDVEKDLAIKAKNGDREAKNRLIESNLRFVITCAKQYVNQGVPLVDLISAGNLGLNLALVNYDPDRGYKFFTFAVWYIRREILKEIYNNGRTIRYPVSYISNISKVKKAYDSFVLNNNREPTEEELIHLANISQKQLDSVLLDRSFCESLNTPVYENVLLEDVIEDDSTNTESSFVTNDLLKCINTLPERERKVIKEYYGIGCPNKKIEELAQELRLSPERIRQIKKSGLRKMEKFKPILKSLV